MKKGLSIIIAVALVFIYAGSAMADASCSVCKGTAPSIDCPDEQGDSFCIFDYDGNKSFAGEPDKQGLCQEQPVKAIFDICSCPEGCDIQAGKVLGVKIEILTKGVYFAKDLDITADRDGDGLATGQTPEDNRLRFGLYVKSGADGSNTACAASAADLNANVGNSNAAARYFDDVAYYAVNNLTDPIAPVQAECLSTGVANANKAKVVMVKKSGGYIINKTDAIRGICQMWVDVPAMIVNPAEYTDAMAGEKVKIKLSAFTENGSVNSTIADTVTSNALNSNEVLIAGRTVDMMRTITSGALNKAVLLADGTVFVSPTGNLMVAKDDPNKGDIVGNISVNSPVIYDVVGYEEIKPDTTREVKVDSEVLLTGTINAANFRGNRVMVYSRTGQPVLAVAATAPAAAPRYTAADANVYALILAPQAPVVDEQWDFYAKYLCPDCHTPCGCEITVAQFCCEADKYGLIYPYFAPDVDESYFWNGLVISNLTNEDGTAKITIYEEDGDVGETTVTIKANGFFNELLRNIPNITLTKTGQGDTSGSIGNSKSYVWVCTNFRTEGFAMLSDQAGQGESMGYLPKLYFNPDSKKSILNCK